MFRLPGLRGVVVSSRQIPPVPATPVPARTSWAFRLLGLLGLSSFRTSWAFRLLGFLGLFVL